MGLVLFEIRFACPDRSYKPLDIISGCIIVQVSGEAEKVETLTVELKGLARTEWDDAADRLIHHGEEEVYSNSVTSVQTFVDGFGVSSCCCYPDPTHSIPTITISTARIVHEVGRIPVGRHSVPFHVLLPAEIPYSYESPLASIRYKVEAVLKRPGFFKTDERRIEHFTVCQEPTNR